MYTEPSMRIYGCGGCGINICQDVLNTAVFNESTMINTEISLIDTSYANYKKASGMDFFKIPGIQGTGKSASESLNISEDKIEPFLRSNKPGDLNIILCSGGGGTGSVIGYQIAKHLGEQGIPYLVILVASTDSAIESENSHKSLMRLQKIVKDTARPVPYCYFENDSTAPENSGCRGPRTLVDEMIAQTILCVSELASENHRELDRNDVRNFFCYDNVTSVNPQLVELSIGFDAESLSVFDGKTISMAAILHDHDSAKPDLGQQYETTGYFKEVTEGKRSAEKFFLLTAANTVSYAAHLKETRRDYQEVASQLNAVNEIDIDDEDDLF